MGVSDSHVRRPGHRTLVVGVIAGWLAQRLQQPVITSLLLRRLPSRRNPAARIGNHGLLACGLWLGHSLEITAAKHHTAVSEWWYQGWIANSALFLLAGATVTVNVFEERWLAMLIGIGAASLSSPDQRLVSLQHLASVIPARGNISADFKLFMTIGGLRGAVANMVLSLPADSRVGGQCNYALRRSTVFTVIQARLHRAAVDAPEQATHITTSASSIRRSPRRAPD